MKHDQRPTLDTRDAAQVFAELLARQPAYLPDWNPAKGSPGWALLQIFARYSEAIIERLNQAPDKNLLAFLDQLGINLISARAARAPVVFQPLPNAANARIAAGSRLGARVPDYAQPIMFETENAIALAAARLVEVRTLWPARDAYANHTVDAVGNRPFTLFEPLQPVPYELYLAHDTLFAFSGKTTLQIQFDLATGGSKALRVAWEHWDGQVWRPFKAFDAGDSKASQDSTDGLTRSGTVTLRAGCGRSVKSKVHGIDAHWVRGRLDEPLPPDASQVLPLIDRIGLRAVIEREFGILESTAQGSQPTAGLLPDHAFADGSKLDTTKIFYPFGRAPDKDSTFYFACEEIFGKPGAEVTLQFRRAINPEDEADKHSERFERDVNHARHVLIAAVKEAAQGVLDAAINLEQVSKPLKSYTAWTAALNALKKAVQDFPEQGDYLGLGTFPDKARHLVGKVENVITEVEKFSALQKPSTQSPTPQEIDKLYKSYEDCYKKIKEAAHHLKSVLTAVIPYDAETKPGGLVTLGPVKAAVSAGTELPELLPPSLVWEYWNGQRWQALIPPSDPKKEPAKNFWFDKPPDPKASPAPVMVSFWVPQDMAALSVNDVKARWIRVRLLNGSYGRLKLVSWYDAEAGKVNFFPIIEPRPPALDMFSFSYVYRSSASGNGAGALDTGWGSTGGSSFTMPPEHCLTYNDFQFEVHTNDVRWPGRLFSPFRPAPDATPALYLGFDRPLPNDLISLYADVEERATAAPAMVWEAWDGSNWQELSVSDETADLQRPGMVSFIAPQVPKRPQAVVARAQGTEILARNTLDVAVFQAGDRVVIARDETREMAVIQRIEGTTLHLEAPLANTYIDASVSLAALPRFGTPRDWVRARLRVDGAPRKSAIHGIYLNAVWAVQRQTIENEMLGSGTGQPSQAFFISQTPVLPGEWIEIRELEGPRAAVELPILREELISQGFADDDIRPVADRVTGRVAEVWVRWRFRPHLFFSLPEDRHYTIERTRGRLIFGDGRNGRLPPVGANNIQARRYQAGGGSKGNVAAGAISQLLSDAVYVQEVTNPHAADGGADSERPKAVTIRGPQTLRHRYRALAARDYEALAQEASPGVAAVRVLPATAPNGRPAPGWVTVIIVPQSQEDRPQPSFELRRQVHAYLAARAPATVAAERIAVIGPTYLPVGVAATVAARDASEAGVVKQRLEKTLRDFLQPLTGGPDGCGWPFGRDVHLSDLAAVVEAVTGVDYAERLEFMLNDSPQGEVVEVPTDRMVVAGPLVVKVVAAEP